MTNDELFKRLSDLCDRADKMVGSEYEFKYVKEYTVYTRSSRHLHTWVRYWMSGEGRCTKSEKIFILNMANEMHEQLNKMESK